MLLTVIIPVYKVADTIDRCLVSVTNQSYRQMEILLVDDGSPDSCPQICDSWATKDQRIRVIHKLNGGLSSARNAALDIAQGDLITFIDSDDFIVEDTFAAVVKHMSADVDIVEYPILLFYGSRRQSLLAFNEKTYNTLEDYWINGRAYEHTYVCNKIFRRELFNSIRFPVGEVFEDVCTLPRLLVKARAVKTVNIGLYYYCANPQGITNTAGGNELSQLLKAHIHNFSPITDERYYLHVLNIQLDVYSRTGETPILNNLEIKHVWQQGFKNGMKLLTLNKFGLRTICNIYRFIYKVKCFIKNKM